ncbi:MAG: glycosyltransferase family 4 protein, partial [Sulfuricaulis sp.]|nr:glycosyltransferase family 4 protein [Sulfuricaulis sp.]
PKKYGGTERVVSALTEELVRRGHEVTLYASGDSLTSARLRSVHPQALREARVKDLYGLNILSVLNIGLAYQAQAEFDIIHDHSGHIGLPTANLATTPVAMTYHGPFTGEVRRIFNELRQPSIITISRSQRELAPDLNHLGTVYNGLAMENYPFSAEHDGYLLFVGRISPEKGVHFAVRAALTLGLPLIIAAKLERVDRPYYYRRIKPYLSEQIRWIGEVDETERNRLMSRALCFLHPVTWPEPFGLTLIEAMACGCPVIAFNKGSIPELIKDGETGYVVETLSSMLDAIRGVAKIDRAACRRHALEHFSAQKMADGYEALYRQLLS